MTPPGYDVGDVYWADLLVDRECCGPEMVDFSAQSQAAWRLDVDEDLPALPAKRLR